VSNSQIYILITSIYVFALVPDIIKLVKVIKSPKLDINASKLIMKANIVTLILAIAMLTVLVALEVNIFNYSAPVKYSSINDITLKDFNGFKLPNQTLQGSNKFAFIETSISVKENKDSYTIVSLFHPSRSYVYFDDLENENLLRHELYHFHITEYIARKLRQSLSEPTNKPNEVNNQIEIHQKLESIMQRDYDYETDHGYLLGKQLQWQKNIDSLLQVNRKYRFTTVSY